MITQADLGWTTDAYNSFVSEVGDPAFQFILEGYTLQISNISDPAYGTTESVSTLDGIVVNDVIIRVWNGTDELVIGRLTSEDTSDQSWTQTTEAVTLDETVPPSLAASGNTVRIFYYDGSAIKYIESSDKGASWGAATAVGTVANVKYLGATSLTRVHYAVLTSKNNIRFDVYNYSGSWTASTGTITWPFFITSFDAITGNQLDDGAASSNDILAFTSDLPPLVKYRVDGTEPVKVLERVQAVCVVRYQNGRWSDHRTVDVIDRLPDNTVARDNVRLSKYGEWMFMTYKRREGSANYYHTSLAVTRSRTGLHWEMPYVLNTSTVGTCAILLVRGKHAYLVDSSGRKARSDRAGYVGSSVISYDLSPYVVAVESVKGDAKEVQLTVANPAGILDQYLDLDTQWQMRLSMGWKIDGVDYTPQIILADLDSISESHQLPGNHRVLAGRDELARSNTIRADHVQEWENWQAGGDNFQNVDETTYSGLRHTAGYAGHWQTAGNILDLRSGSAPGVAFNTQTRWVWNGSAQCGLRLAATDTDDFAGLLFRGFDKYTYHYVVYNSDSDKIVMGERKDNADTALQNSGAKGWSSGTWYYLKVVYRYNSVNVYSSTDGLSWSLEFSKELDGVAQGTSFTFDNIPVMTGSQGFLGHGYSSYNPSYSVPPWEPPPIELPIYDQGWPTVFFFASTGKGVYMTEDFSGTDEAGQPTWTAINGGTDFPADLNLHAFAVDTQDRTNRQFCIGDTDRNVLRRETAAAGGDGDWHNVLTATQYQGASHTNDSHAKAIDLWCDPVTGVVYVYIVSDQVPTGYAAWLSYSTDDGDSWTTNPVDHADVNTHAFARYGTDGGSLESYNGVICISGQWATYRHRALWSSDNGGSWGCSDPIDTSNWDSIVAYGPLSSGYCYTRKPNATFGKWYIAKVTFSTETVVAMESTGLMPHGYDHLNQHWFSPTAEGTQRRVAFLSLAWKMCYTSDEWSSFSSITPSPSVSSICRDVSADDEDRIVYGTHVLGIGVGDNPHAILVAYGDADTTPEGKAGSSPESAPYTGSIPYDCGGPCRNGLQRGDFV